MKSSRFFIVYLSAISLSTSTIACIQESSANNFEPSTEEQNPDAAKNNPTNNEPDVSMKAESKQLSAIEVIHERKSVRSYTNEPVSKELLETAIRAGMAAPTGGNRQPWIFMVVTDREKLDALAKIARGGSMLSGAEAAIMVGGVPAWGIPGEANAYWVQDCSAATQNILLALEAQQLGAVWIGIHPREDREKQVREVLGIPNDVVPLNLIAIGHPAGDEKPKDKFRPERIHWERWNPEAFSAQPHR